MNENNLVPAQSDGSGSAMSMFMDIDVMNKMMTAAKLMASSKVTIPAHLKNSEGDCMAVILQAAQWRMNPFAVAQKTHLSQSGALGYEAQLINAAVVACGAVTTQPDFEFIGDWSKILGKVEERKSDKGGKYYVSAWNKSDEIGLGVITRATLRGESRPREITTMLVQCFPRFSTQWATDPQQQITYVGVRKFSRRYAPGAILGVYTTDELDTPLREHEINPARDPATGQSAAESSAAPAEKHYPADKFEKAFPKFKASIEAGDNTPQDVYDFIKGKGFDVSDEQRKRIGSVKAPIQGSATTVDETKGDMPVVSYAQIAEKLNAATTTDALDEACDLIGEVADEAQRKELGELYDARRIALEA